MEWVLKMARYGFPRTPNEIKEAVKLYLDKSKIKVSSFHENRPGKTWFYAFLRRYPEIKLAKAEKLEQCICANGSVIPPAIIYPGLNFNPEYGIGFPSNFHLGFTKNGWMETSQFYGWLIQIIS